MAAVTETFVSAFNGAVEYDVTFDSTTGVVSTISVTNGLTLPVTCTVANRTITFQPGTTTQDVSQFAWNVSKSANFFPSTQAPAA